MLFVFRLFWCFGMSNSAVSVKSTVVISTLVHFIFALFFVESTKTVQALQYSGDAPAPVNKEFEIRGLKEEIETLKKQISGN